MLLKLLLMVLLRRRAFVVLLSCAGSGVRPDVEADADVDVDVQADDDSNSNSAEPKTVCVNGAHSSAFPRPLITTLQV